jgi:hypothetical protein
MIESITRVNVVLEGKEIKEEAQAPEVLVSYDNLKKAELVEILKERNIEFSAKATKEKMLELLGENK